MNNQDSCVSICDSAIEKDLDEQVDINLNEGKGASDHEHSTYLTASELMNLRHDAFKSKRKDEDVDIYKGPKLYNPSSFDPEEKMSRILQSHKNHLKLQRVAKIKDCMKAEWNDELKVAVVANLKGKTTQHMGRNFKGKIALSPEESLFLLEKNAIEIKRNNMPMSIEEAYSVILKGKLGLEKYQVYSHLSQQGFIVVQHQTRIRSKHEEVLASRKRKAVNGSIDEPGEKRITFTGVLSSISQETASLSMNESTSSNECENIQITELSNAFDSLPSVTLNSHAVDVASCDESNFKSSEIISSTDQAVLPDSTNHVDSVDVIETEASKVPDSPVGLEQNSDISAHRFVDILTNILTEVIQTSVQVDGTENGKSIVSEGDGSCVMPLEAKDQEPTSFQIGQAQVSEQDQIPEVDELKMSEDVIENTDDKNVGGNKCKSDDDTNEVIIEEMPQIDKANDINVDDTYNSDYVNDDDVSDDSMPVICEESEDLDVISCSVSDQQSSYDGFKSTSSDMCVRPSEDHVDDDVTLLEVRKKEKKPLAVIDLLSDEEVETEKQIEEQFEGSDDEIQVVKVCSGSKNSAQSTQRNSNSAKLECKLEGSVVKYSVDVKSYHPQMKFPELFRKDIFCIPRPPVTLLPSRVRPAKEAYVINHTKSQPNQGRVWESFRVMQDYQRDRRLHRQMNNSNPGRPYSSLRDYRFHRDTNSPRMNPFNHGEPSIDSDFERNNQNFPFQQNRDTFNSPLSMNHHNPHAPLLPTPATFNSSNHASFMNMPNMHDLSSPASYPALFVNEIYRTVQSVTSNIIQRTMQSVTNSICGPHMSHMMPMSRSSPPFNVSPAASQHHFNNFSASAPLISEPPPFSSEFYPMHFPSETPFAGDRVPYGMSRDMAFDNSWEMNNMRRRNTERKGPLFPRAYRGVHKKRCWSDIKSSAEASNDKELDSGSDIEEVPINLNQFLWSNDIQPLVKPGVKLPVSEILQKLRITHSANLMQKEKINDNCLPSLSSLEISFDVYLPGFKYKKTAPQVPRLRIVVLRSIDPIPRFSDIVVLKRKFHDDAMLQIAVVDHGDISFYSFNSISVPDLIPFEN